MFKGKASEIVRQKFLACGGRATIALLNGDSCEIKLTSDGCAFTSDKLNRHLFKYELTVFDVVVELLQHSPQGKARKGNAHGKDDKVGRGNCTADTIVGAIAVHYFGKREGESCFDPVFVLAAVLDWADIAENMRGYVRLYR